MNVFTCVRATLSTENDAENEINFGNSGARKMIYVGRDITS
jgi:hypothetical protein